MIEFHCRKEYPKEMCGVILQDGSFLKIPNISETPEEHFILSPIEFYENFSRISYIVHSHCKKGLLDIRTPSLMDIEEQEKWRIPFLIVGFDGNIFYPAIELPRKLNPTYLGRPHIFTINDCGTLIQDFYYYEFNIFFEAIAKDSLVERKFLGETLKKHLIKNNFKISKEPLQKGDIILVSFLGVMDNHAMIYIGDNAVLNQNKISCIEPLELYRNKITSIYRHVAL